MASENYEKTVVLLAQVQDGDGSAREELYRRLIPRLEGFARGRVPSSLQSLTDTQEVVQDTVVRSLRHMDTFKPQHEGALLHYLKKVLMNRIRDQARRGGREIAITDGGLLQDPDDQSPVSKLVGKETLQHFAEALESLPSDQKTAVSLHVEMGYTLGELAEALDRSKEAARKLLFRGLQAIAGKLKSNS